MFTYRIGYICFDVGLIVQKIISYEQEIPFALAWYSFWRAVHQQRFYLDHSVALFLNKFNSV